MLKHLRALSKDSLIYGLGNASSSVVSFLLLPLYTRFLTPEDYGLLAVFTMYQAIIEIASSFGLSSGLFRYYLMADDEEEKRRVLGTCFLIQLSLVLIFALALFASGGLLNGFLFKGQDMGGKLHMVTATALLGSIPSLFQALLRAEKRTRLFAGTQLARTFLLAASNILLVAVLRLNYLGVIISTLGVTTLMVVGFTPFFLKYFLAPFSLPLFRRILAFSAPVCLGNVFAFMLGMSDRYFLNHYLSAAEVGFYSFGSKIGSAVSIALITPFSTAVVPYALSIAKHGDFRIVYAKIIKYFTLAAAVFALPIFFFSKEIVLLVSNPGYLPAWGMVGPTLLAGIFYGMYYAVSVQLDVMEKTYFVTFAVAIAGAVSVTLNFLTIPILGMYGAALSACVANAVLLTIMYIFCQIHMPMPYEFTAFLKLVGLVAISVGVFMIIERKVGSSAFRYVAKVVYLLALPGAGIALGILDARERGALVRGIAKFRGVVSK